MAVYRLYHNQQDNRWYLKYIQIKPFTVKHLLSDLTKLPNSEQSYKRKVQTHNYINRQNQSTTGKL
jgi:hypothetical protein